MDPVSSNPPPQMGVSGEVFFSWAQVPFPYKSYSFKPYVQGGDPFIRVHCALQDFWTFINIQNHA